MLALLRQLTHVRYTTSDVISITLICLSLLNHYTMLPIPNLVLTILQHFCPFLRLLIRQNHLLPLMTSILRHRAVWSSTTWRIMWSTTDATTAWWIHHSHISLLYWMFLHMSILIIWHIMVILLIATISHPCGCIGVLMFEVVHFGVIDNSRALILVFSEKGAVLMVLLWLNVGFMLGEGLQLAGCALTGAIWMMRSVGTMSVTCLILVNIDRRRLHQNLWRGHLIFLVIRGKRFSCLISIYTSECCLVSLIITLLFLVHYIIPAYIKILRNAFICIIVITHSAALWNNGI